MVHGLRSNPWRDLKATIRKMTGADMEAEIHRIMRVNGLECLFGHRRNFQKHPMQEIVKRGLCSQCPSP